MDTPCTSIFCPRSKSSAPNTAPFDNPDLLRVNAEFPQDLACVDPRFRNMTFQRLCHTLRAAFSKRNLYSAITVGSDRLDLCHAVIRYAQHSDGNGFPFRRKKPHHAHFVSYQPKAHVLLHCNLDYDWPSIHLSVQEYAKTANYKLDILLIASILSDGAYIFTHLPPLFLRCALIHPLFLLLLLAKAKKINEFAKINHGRCAQVCA